MEKEVAPIVGMMLVLVASGSMLMGYVIRGFFEKRDRALLKRTMDENEELQQAFDAMIKANRRGITAWQEKTGRKLEWPDQARTVEWLADELEEATTKRVEYEALWAETAEQSEKLGATTHEMVEALRLAEAALVDLGACDNPDCKEPGCLHALASVRAAIAMMNLCDDEGCPQNGVPHVCINRTLGIGKERSDD